MFFETTFLCRKISALESFFNKLMDQKKTLSEVGFVNFAIFFITNFVEHFHTTTYTRFFVVMNQTRINYFVLILSILTILSILSQSFALTKLTSTEKKTHT